MPNNIPIYMHMPSRSEMMRRRKLHAEKMAKIKECKRLAREIQVAAKKAQRAQVKHKLQFKVLSVDSSVLIFSGFKTNCIVVWRDKKAVVVDPGGDAAKISRFLRQKGLKVGAYWLTHAHPDHVNGLSELLDEFPAPVRYHCADNLLLGVALPILLISEAKRFRPFEKIQTLKCDDIIAGVIHTPGHTGGSVCYWFPEEKVLLSGDTIGRGWIGRTIFPGGSLSSINDSIFKLHWMFQREIKVLPGHGRETVLGVKKLAIPY